MVRSALPSKEKSYKTLLGDVQRRNEIEQLRHINARTIDEALSLLADYGERAKIIAGSVDVISLMKNKIISPSILVNVKSIPGLRYIKQDSESLKIGALASIKDISVSTVVRERYNLLTEAALSVAGPQIRNMATISGNLCQETRCWYYRRPPVTGRIFFCLRKGGRACYALGGQNAYHAIIEAKKCHSAFPSDMAVALTALGAKVKIVGAAGDRTIPLEEFYNEFGTNLRPTEMIVEIQLPTPESNTKQQYLKFRYRKSIDFAISSVAAVIRIIKETVSDARIVLGGVAPTPYLAKQAEEVLKGKRLTQGLAETATKKALAKVKPLSMNGYKVQLTEALIKRAILE